MIFGEVIEDHQPENIAKAVMALKEKGKAPFTEKLKQATAENNWEREQQVWREIFGKYR